MELTCRILLLFKICLVIIIPIITSSSLRTIKENGKLTMDMSQRKAEKSEQLDDAGNIFLKWEVNEAESLITFEIDAWTEGYIGFGISPGGSMKGADIFIAGVNPDGSIYSSDRYATGFEKPLIDNHSDWTLVSAMELPEDSVGPTLTFITFSRLLNTCDEQDYPITAGTTRVIWALGDSDDVTKHAADRRGSRSINLLGAPMPQLDLEGVQEWDLALDMEMPGLDTSYWCSLHKGPILNEKHHIVAFDALLPDENSLKHTHHFVLSRCYLPPDGSLDEAFANSTVDKGVIGDMCYETNTKLPFMGMECVDYFYVWAKGGKKMVFPENAGYPIGVEDGGKPQYYKLEVHYDNPELAQNVKFRTGVKIYYTNKLREHDAGQLMISHEVSIAQLVPPNMTDFVTVGHCDPACTAQFPSEGLKVFNVLLHSHLSGRKLKLRHFRDGIELPYIDYDDHYDFNYQQNNPLFKDITILPGDQLAYECTYDSTWKDGEVVLGGLSTREEMCEVFIWYWPQQDIQICSSYYPIDKSLKDLGITAFHEVDNEDYVGIKGYYIDEPENLKGHFFDSMNKKFNWTIDNSRELEKTRRYGEHVANCIKRNEYDQPPQGLMIKYPKDVVEYVPVDVCDPDYVPSSTTPATTITSDDPRTTTTKPTTTQRNDQSSKASKTFTNSIYLIIGLILINC